MPRTKQVKKKSSNFLNDPKLIMIKDDFSKHVQNRIRHTEAEMDIGINSKVFAMDRALSRLPKEIRELTTENFINFINGESDDDDDDDDDYDDDEYTSDTYESPSYDKNKRRVVVPPSTVKQNKTSKASKRETATSTDDGYVTESSAGTRKRTSRIDGMSVSSKKPMRTRSSSVTEEKRGRITRQSKSQSRNQERIIPTKRSRSCSQRSSKRPTAALVSTDYTHYKTPKSKFKEFTPITPKVQPNTPINILRRPRDGEIAISMQGSPLLVNLMSTGSSDRLANVNIPLINGDIMSILPNEGLRISNLPPLDEVTKRQLQILHRNLGAVFAAEQ